MLSSPGHACERGGLLRAESPQSSHLSPSQERTGQASLLSLSSHPPQIRANLFRAFLFVSLFFWPGTPSHRQVDTFIQLAFCLKGASFSLYSGNRERVKCWFSWFALWMKWRGAGHRILEDNLATPPWDTRTFPHSVARGTICLTLSQVFPRMLFPDGLEKILGPNKRTQATRICYAALNGTSWVSDCSYRTESSYHRPRKFFFCRLALIARKIQDIVQ